MSQLLLDNVEGDLEGAAKKVRGACAILLEGEIGSATVTIKVGRVGDTREAVAKFDVTDDDPTQWDNNRGRCRLVEIAGEYDISADVNGVGDHNLSVALLI